MTTSIITQLNTYYDASSVVIRAFRDFPLVVDKLRQLNAAYSVAPESGLCLEFGVFSGGSIRSLAFFDPKQVFHGFDSFEGLPEAWKLNDTTTYEAGHFGLDALPDVPENVRLTKGFFEDSLDPWLEENQGPVKFVHIDGDLYSSAKTVLEKLSHRFVEGTVLVFDELSDWEDSGVYPLWREGEWKALLEWLRLGFQFRILSRAHAHQAAIQIYRAQPKPLKAIEILARATAFWDAGCRAEAIAILDEVAREKPSWLGGNYTLATWQSKFKQPEAVLETIERLAPALAEQPDHIYASEVVRLRAAAHLRLYNNDQAFADAVAFNAARPDHIGGMTLAARAATGVKEYELAQQLWHRAYCLTGEKSYRIEARMAGFLTAVRPDLRAMKFSAPAIEHLIANHDFTTVLDIGSGAGEQAKALRRHGKTVTELDYGKSKYFVLNPDEGGAIIGDFMEAEIAEQFDCVIASHVLEHQLNVGAFLKKLHSVVKEGGLVAISVPPLKHQIVGGHVTLWNAGILLYNLVLAGFDCSTPWIRRYGNNISVVITKKTVTPENLEYDSGDVDRIAAYLPPGCEEGFDGDFLEYGD